VNALLLQVACDARVHLPRRNAACRRCGPLPFSYPETSTLWSNFSDSRHGQATVHQVKFDFEYNDICVLRAT
jgi:hypothetical protein